MPTTTTTTTVTGGGATTTSTVTATVAGGDAVQDTPAVALIKDLLASWGAGKLIEEKGKFFSKDMVLVAGPGTIPSWGTYNFDTLDVHLTEQAQYDFNDFELVRYTPTSDGCFMEWSVSSFGLKATGQKTGPCSTTQKFIVADGKVTHCSLTFSNFGAIEALVKAANVDVIQAMLGSWGAGNLIEQKADYFAESLEVDTGTGKIPGWDKYTFATFADWIGEPGIGQYEFKDMNWEVYTAPGGAIGEWTVSSLVRLATGKATGPLSGFNRFTLNGGKITKVSIVFSADDNAQIEALFA